MRNPISATRREVISASLGIAAVLPADAENANSHRPVLTPADKFVDVSRGAPIPHSLRGEKQADAGLTPQTWQLEILGEGTTKVAIPLTRASGNALDYRALLALGDAGHVTFIKAMQCLNIEEPLGQGLWEGVPLRTVLGLVGQCSNVRRVYYSGFHNNEASQLFQSSLSLTDALESPPGCPPACLVYRLNGQPLPPERGGPVRMVIPWAHGFKSIKWLNKITLTNEFRANDTYADANNDPESHLKTAAYLNDIPEKVTVGSELTLRGVVVCGLSGLARVECWLRPSTTRQAPVTPQSSEWQHANWRTATIQPAPTHWNSELPPGTDVSAVYGFRKSKRSPTIWPMPYTMASWSFHIGKIPPGTYEIRARAVDLNGFAQPEPRPDRQTGLNPVQVARFVVVT